MPVPLRYRHCKLIRLLAYRRRAILVLLPVPGQFLDHHVADAPCSLERRQVGAVVTDFRFGQTFGGGYPRMLLIEVAGRAQDQYAAEVGAASPAEKGEG